MFVYMFIVNATKMIGCSDNISDSYAIWKSLYNDTVIIDYYEIDALRKHVLDDFVFNLERVYIASDYISSTEIVYEMFDENYEMLLFYKIKEKYTPQPKAFTFE